MEELKIYMKCKIETALEEIKQSLELVSPEIRGWAENYLEKQKHRYVHTISNLVERYYTSGYILEIGSVPCHLTYILKRLGYPVVGMDINPNRVIGFIRKYNLDIIKFDIEVSNFPFKDNTFDVVLFTEVLEHLRINPLHVLKEINRVLKPGGILVLTTPNLYSLWNVGRFLIGRGIFPDPYTEFKKLEEIGHMGHIREYSVKEIKKLLENTNFVVIEHKYVFYRNKSFITSLIFNILPILRPKLDIIAMKRV